MKLRVSFDGTSVEADAGSTLLQAALLAGFYVPALCAHPDLPPQASCAPAASIVHGTTRIDHDTTADGPPGCGICMVEVEGEGRVPACATQARDGMRVATASPELAAFRRGRLAEILAHHPHACLTCAMREGCTREPCSMNVPVRERCCSLLGRCELQAVADHVGIDAATLRYVPGDDLRTDAEPLFDRDPALCIACGRCVSACAGREVHALGWVRDTSGRRWVGPLEPALPESGCRFCGSCVEVCPTGALMDRGIKPADRAESLVPCRAACPAGTDVPRYVGLVAEGRLEDAAAVVAERAPLVEVLGQVCFHPCEDACRRHHVNGAPISICAIKREAGAASATGWASRLPPPAAPTGRKAAVVGAGPAGLMAAHVLRLLGHAVTLFEAAPSIGGLLARGIPAFRLSPEVVGRETRALTEGIDVRTGARIGPGGTSIDQLRQTYDVAIVATGGGSGASLEVDGEDLPGVRMGLELLRDLAEARLEGPIFPGQVVVVVGGGNVAIDCARAATRLGAARVELVCLEPRDQMPAYAHEVRAAAEESVSFRHRWGIHAFTGNGRLSHVHLKRCVRVFDADGRFSPAYDDSERDVVEADAAIVAIGQRADRTLLPRSLENVFLAGDLATGPRSVVEALASGRTAALAADRYLGGTGDLHLQLSSAARPAALGRMDGFARLPRVEPARCAPGLGVPAGLGPDRARQEADRCLRCDLRLAYQQPARPPSRRIRLALVETSVEQMPDVEGVLRFFDASGEIVGILGVPSMRGALASSLGACRATHVEFEACAMFTQRQNELLSQFVEAHGRMPVGLGGDDDVDDLF